MDFNALGIQTVPFAVHSAHFVLKISQLFHFHTGEPFLFTTNNGKGEFTQPQNWMKQMDFNAWGIQTVTFAVHSAHFVLKISQLHHFYTGEPFFITPEDQ